MIMQMYPLLLSLALRGPSHALLAPVVVSTTHGLPGSAPLCVMCALRFLALTNL